VTNPEDPKLLCEFSTARPAAARHMNFYDGGRYALVDAGWSNEFRMENAQRPNGNGFMCWIWPTRATSRKSALAHSRTALQRRRGVQKCWFAGDHASWDVLTRRPHPEGASKMAARWPFAASGHFGMVLMDLVDPKHPKVISQYRPAHETMGGIPFHTIFRCTPAAIRNCRTSSSPLPRLSSRTAAKPVQAACR